MKSFFKHANPDAFTELELAVMEGGNDLNDIKDMSESYSSEPELKHRVSVTVSDPQHTMASKRKEKIEKKVRLYAKDEKHAQELAKHHFKKQGYKVHNLNYIGVTEEQVDEVSMGLLTRYKEKAGQQASAMNKAIPAVAASSAAPEHKKAAINALVQKGNKRFSGIIKATNKQFAKSMKKEEVVMNEAVTVKKQNYSWGKMVTVHHGSDTSYPLHPEHQAKIKALKPGEKTSFKDETNRTVHAEREGDKVHLSSKNSSTKTTVAHSHFAEQMGNEPKSVPFTGSAKKTGTVTDKSGAKHTPMSRARHLARFAAFQQQKKQEPK